MKHFFETMNPMKSMVVDQQRGRMLGDYRFACAQSMWQTVTVDLSEDNPRALFEWPKHERPEDNVDVVYEVGFDVIEASERAVECLEWGIQVADMPFRPMRGLVLHWLGRRALEIPIILTDNHTTRFGFEPDDDLRRNAPWLEIPDLLECKPITLRLRAEAWRLTPPAW